MTKEEWLESLKVGDVVVINNRWGNSLAKIDRITPTQFVIGFNKFKRINGIEVGGDSWNHTSLCEYTETHKQQFRKSKLVKLLKDNVRWEALSLETLEKIVSLVPEEAKK